MVSRKITNFLVQSSSSVAATPATTSTSTSASSAISEMSGPAPKKSKHRDSYNPKWRELFPWLQYVDDTDGPSMFCSVCQRHNKSAASKSKMVWISIPCRQFRQDKLREHEKTKIHTEAMKSEALAAIARRTGGIRAALEDQVTLQRQAVKGALKCMYWLAKEEVAHHTKFNSLLELGKFLGCSYLAELQVAKNTTYTSHRMIDDFLTTLSDSLENEILSKVRNSLAMGILCDETTDVSSLKQLAVFVQYVFQGKTKTSFLKIADLPNGKADTIENKLLDMCRQCEIPMNKVFGFGSDGASVMVGRVSGVATRMKAHNPELVFIHCGAHRVALASSQAATQIPYLKKFDSHLTTLYYHFENSPVREAALHHIQEIMGDPELKLKKAIHTRWLSHDQAISAIRRTLSSIITTLEKEVTEDDDPVARGLIQSIKSHYFVSTVYLLSDVLPHLSTLSLVFQTENIDFSIVKPQVAATIGALKHLRENPGPHLRQLDGTLQSLSTDFGLVTSSTLKLQFQENIRKRYIDKIQKH